MEKLNTGTIEFTTETESKKVKQLALDVACKAIEEWKKNKQLTKGQAFAIKHFIVRYSQDFVWNCNVQVTEIDVKFGMPYFYLMVLCKNYLTGGKLLSHTDILMFQEWTLVEYWRKGQFKHGSRLYERYSRMNQETTLLVMFRVLLDSKTEKGGYTYFRAQSPKTLEDVQNQVVSICNLWQEIKKLTKNTRNYEL